jgi:sRNA-binding carbon storage regulator CsrA
MSLTISRRSGESFVLIDENDPDSFVLVTVGRIDGNKAAVTINAPQNVQILRREILHRYAIHKDVIAGVEQQEAQRRD